MPEKATTERPAAFPELPAAIIQALPIVKEVLINLSISNDLIRLMERDMRDAERVGAIPLARAFVALHRLKAYRDDNDKAFSALFENYKNVVLPRVFETEGVTSLPLAEGFRVGISSSTRASIRPEQKEAAYDWLRDNGLGDIITPVVNASTLSATARTMFEDENRELPPELFNVAIVPNTSVTTTKK